MTARGKSNPGMAADAGKSTEVGVKAKALAFKEVVLFPVSSKKVQVQVKSVVYPVKLASIWRVVPGLAARGPVIVTAI